MGQSPLTLIVAGLDRPPRALLVDVDAETRQMYAAFLRQAHCDIEEAADGREALAKALSRRPDVVVSETRLPGISGLDLCRLLHADAEMHHVPVVFVTGDVYEADVKRAVAAGAHAVLVKPCLPDRLAHAVRDALESARHARGGFADAEHHPAAVASSAADAGGQQTAPARSVLSRTYHRHDTTDPPLAPPALICPQCERPLSYVKSYVGGVSERHREQWDYLECASGCGTFQYRQRTRKLRRVPQ